MYVYMYTYICVCVCVYICIYIYIYIKEEGGMSGDDVRVCACVRVGVSNI
jgi:hypothetical protein